MALRAAQSSQGKIRSTAARSRVLDLLLLLLLLLLRMRVVWPLSPDGSQLSHQMVAVECQTPIGSGVFQASLRETLPNQSQRSELNDTRLDFVFSEAERPQLSPFEVLEVPQLSRAPLKMLTEGQPQVAVGRLINHRRCHTREDIVPSDR
jgi:hypothetical protein